ncbi:DUF5988 family protein [Actinophytocola sp.]|jgi:hypothetical protein|uniref:DUF5988 family protein n=1 Tax=Actinophytocola sp. TaxID=1872138 RepID=UPI002EDA6258
MSSVRVVLSGGPAELPDSARLPEVADLADKVKIPFASGHEHFVYRGGNRDIDGVPVPVFEWCDRTRVAE